MFRKKLLAMGLIITIALCGLSGCTGNTTTAPQETTTPEVTSGQEETSTEEEETTTEYDNTSDVYGKVDVEDVCKHLVIDGKQVDFPWTLNSLGEEYTFDSVVSSDDGVTHATGLYYNDDLKFVVGVWDDGEVDRDSKIYTVDFSLNIGVEFFDFNNETIPEEIEYKFGEPTRITSDEITTSYRYECDDIYLWFNFKNTDSKLRAIGITLYDVEEGK